MSNDQDPFYDLPFGKMSQTAKRYSYDDFDKENKNVVSTPDNIHLYNHSTYPVGIVGRATRQADEHQPHMPVSKSLKRAADQDIFLHEDQFSLLPFESLPHPQKLRKKVSRRVKAPKIDFNKDFLVDNHLRQLKKRYNACVISSETYHEQSLGESSETVDSGTQSSEEVGSCYTDEVSPRTSDNSMSRTSDNLMSRMSDNLMSKTSNNLISKTRNQLMTSLQGNPVKMTYLDMELRKEFLMQENWQPFSSSTPVKEE